MRLLEFESKEIFGEFGIPLANYITINSSDEIFHSVRINIVKFNE